jgi:hypothetical protein
VRGAADRVPAHLLARAKELFMEFDLDGRGVIEAAEVKTVLTGAAPPCPAGEGMHHARVHRGGASSPPRTSTRLARPQCSARTCSRGMCR